MWKRSSKQTNQDYRAKAEELLDSVLQDMLPDPYDFHSIKVKSVLEGDEFVHYATVDFLLPDGFDKSYTYRIYGLNKSDMQLFAIKAIREMLKQDRQSPLL